jgi:hypothetical protein
MRNYRTFLEDLAFTFLDDVPLGWLVVMTGTSLSIFFCAVFLTILTKR